jgi:hypothetical protein
VGLRCILLHRAALLQRPKSVSRMRMQLVLKEDIMRADQSCTCGFADTLQIAERNNERPNPPRSLTLEAHSLF